MGREAVHREDHRAAVISTQAAQSCTQGTPFHEPCPWAPNSAFHPSHKIAHFFT